jgi:hypothetical protein
MMVELKGLRLSCVVLLVSRREQKWHAEMVVVPRCCGVVGDSSAVILSVASWLHPLT